MTDASLRGAPFVVFFGLAPLHGCPADDDAPDSLRLALGPDGEALKVPFRLRRPETARRRRALARGVPLPVVGLTSSWAES